MLCNLHSGIGVQLQWNSAKCLLRYILDLW